jgi:hypothetical protein
LVRKSLLVTDRTRSQTRYQLLETIRHFGEEQLVSSGVIDDVRRCHAGYYSSEAVARWRLWDSPQQRTATDWVDVEFANLRAAFRFAVDHGDVATAATIAAHTTRLSFPLLWLEPIGWALEILDAAVVADVPHLARLYSAASLCCYIGRIDDAVDYAGTAIALEANPRYEPFEPGWTDFLEAVANVFAGRIDRYIEVSRRLALQTGGPRAIGLAALTWALPAVGRADEAMAIADEALVSARDHGNPFWTEMALYGCGRAFADTDPQRALHALRQGVREARENRHAFWEAVIAQDAALLEALHGDLDEALALYDDTIESFKVAGNYENVAATLAYLAVCFERFGNPEVAAILYGASSGHGSLVWVIHLDEVTDRLRSVLGASEFDKSALHGSSLSPVDAVKYAREQIAFARPTLATRGKSRREVNGANGHRRS